MLNQVIQKLLYHHNFLFGQVLDGPADAVHRYPDARVLHLQGSLQPFEIRIAPRLLQLDFLLLFGLRDLDDEGFG